MFPTSFLNETCKYSLSINGVNIQARVVENNKELIDSCVAEIRSRLDPTFPIVGFDLKHVKLSESRQGNTNNGYAKAGDVVNYMCYRSLLVLHVKDLCLVLKLQGIISQKSLTGAVTPYDSVCSLLKDNSICFLGWEVSKKLNLVLPNGNNSSMACVNNVGSLAARVLKIRELESCFNLVDLASKVGGAAATTVKEDEASRIMKEDIEISGFRDINDVCFTEDEVKYAVLDAYRCYTIATQLMTKYKS